MVADPVFQDQDQGWVSLHRKTLDSQVFQNEGLLKVWIWCLLRANHQETWKTIKAGRNITEVHLMPGQFVFGRKSAAKKLRMSPSTIWKRMQKLKNMRNCDIESNNLYSIITIINWDAYQNENNKGDIKGDHRVTTEEPPSDTDNNVNNVNNVDKEKKRPIHSAVETSQKQNIPYEEIITHLNKTAGTHFRHSTKETKSHINARWAEGYRLDEFKYVIEVKTSKWLNDPEMQAYLRPKTLFGPKFEGYLNEKPLHPLTGTLSPLGIRCVESFKNWEPPEDRAKGKEKIK